jgi:hypothetical protein
MIEPCPQHWRWSPPVLSSTEHDDGIAHFCPISTSPRNDGAESEEPKGNEYNDRIAAEAEN